MSESSPQSVQNLFQEWSIDTSVVQTATMNTFPSREFSQNDQEAILRQIHPIFLNTHTEEKPQLPQTNFDKFLNFLRLSLEWILKLVDILVDAAIQIARLFVWIVAIMGILIVVTLMTNTTDKFIDILNSSIFPIIWVKTTIQKVWPTTPVIALPGSQSYQQNRDESSTLDPIDPIGTTPDDTSENNEVITDSALESNIVQPKKTKIELLREKRLREKNLESVTS